MGWGWGGRTHCRESLEEVHWALKDAGDFTKQKRGLVWAQAGRWGGNLECVRRQLSVVRGLGCTASLAEGEEAEDMNQVSLQICLFKQAPPKHLLSEWVNEWTFPQVRHIWSSDAWGSRHGMFAWQQVVMRYSPSAVVQPISSKIVNFPKVQYLLGPRIRKHPHSVNWFCYKRWGFFFFYNLPSLPTSFHTISPFFIIIYFRLFWQLPLTSSNNILKLLFPGLSTFDSIYSFL